jgi:hypothetical protein
MMKRYLLDPLAPEFRRGWLSLLPSFDGEGEGGGDDGDSGEDDSSDDGGDDEKDESEEGAGDEEKDDKARDSELAKLKRASKRAAAEAKKWREIAQGKRKADDDGDENKDEGPDFRTAALVSTGVTALTAAGYSGTPSRAQRLIELADLRGIEPDSRGLFSSDDFGDVVDEIREEFPELFRSEDDDDTTSNRRQGPRGVNRRSSGTTSNAGGGKKLTQDEKFANMLLGSAGYENAARKVRQGNG